jgi:hypothetical protein
MIILSSADKAGNCSSEFVLIGGPTFDGADHGEERLERVETPDVVRCRVAVRVEEQFEPIGPNGRTKVVGWRVQLGDRGRWPEETMDVSTHVDVVLPAHAAPEKKCREFAIEVPDQAAPKSGSSY